jgi:hypothetical protein
MTGLAMRVTLTAFWTVFAVAKVLTMHHPGWGWQPMPWAIAVVAVECAFAVGLWLPAGRWLAAAGSALFLAAATAYHTMDLIGSDAGCGCAGVLELGSQPLAVVSVLGCLLSCALVARGQDLDAARG